MLERSWSLTFGVVPSDEAASVLVAFVESPGLTELSCARVIDCFTTFSRALFLNFSACYCRIDYLFDVTTQFLDCRAKFVILGDCTSTAILFAST